MISGREVERTVGPGAAMASPAWLTKLLCAVLLTWLAWEILSTTAGENLATEEAPGPIVAWVGTHPRALVDLAERELAANPDKSEVDDIAAMAGQALKADPLQSGALRVLALASAANGDIEHAKGLMRLAGSRSLRDVKAQAWLFDQQLAAKDYGAALTHIDAILRVSPSLREPLLPVLVGFANDPAGRGALIARLKTLPPWRGWLLARLPSESPNPAGLYGVYGALESQERPLTIEEFRPFLQRLVATGDYERAYAMQVDFLPTERIAMLGLLNNGSFEYPVSGLPFDWSISDVRGARTDIVVDDKANLQLRVEFYGARVPFRHVGQSLLLQSGRYRFFGEVKVTDLRSERGMQWTISCAEGAHERLAATERVAGTAPWTTFEVSFEVPTREDCRAQEIRLVLAARIAAEQEVAGEIRYDSLRIERQAEAQPEQGDAGADRAGQ